MKIKRNFFVTLFSLSLLFNVMTSCANNHENTSDTSETVPESQIESIPSRKDEIGLKSNTYYSIMNCDTGRTIKVNGEDEFLLNQNEDGFYSLTDKNGKYLHFASNSAELSENEKFFNITLDNSYNRYQIITDGGLVLTDDDKGETNEASLSLRASKYRGIESGWYFTEAGEERPLKVAFVGDSITCGVSPADTFVPGGFRTELSSKLLHEEGRIVCVGTLKHARNGNVPATDNTTIDDDHLYRHEGHSGWVIHYQEAYRGGTDNNNRGIDDDGVYLLNDGVTQEERHVRRTLMEKYNPDVVSLMIGFNDIGVSNGDYDGIIERWKTLVNNILGSMQDNGALIVGSVHNRPYNERLEEAIKLLKDDRVILSDTFNALSAGGKDAISSDGVHLNSTGNAIIANTYFDCFASIRNKIKGIQ